MSLIVTCERCGKQYSMRPERAGQTLPCRECGSKMRVPGNGSPISPMVAIVGGSSIGLILLIIGIAVTYSSRSAMRSAPEVPLASNSPFGNEAASSPPAVASNQAPTTQPVPVGQGTGFVPPASNAGIPANPISPPAAADPADDVDRRFDEMYEEQRRRFAEQGIELPERPQRTPQNPPSGENNNAMAGREPAPKEPGFRPENEKIRSRIGEWTPCIDPIPADFLPAWEPAKSNKQEFHGSGRTDSIYAGAGSPFVAIETQTFGEEWTVYDLRSKRPVGLAFAGGHVFSKRSLRRDGKYFAATSEGGVRLTDVREKFVIGTFTADVGSEGRIAFLGNDRLAVCTTRQLLVWTVPKGQLVHNIDLPEAHFGRTIGFSAGGRYAAMFSTEHGQLAVRLLDLTTGDDAGLLYGRSSDRSSSYTALGFSDDGTELAAVVGNSLQVWDLQTGEIVEDIDLGMNAPQRSGFEHGEVQFFPDKQKWLINGSVVVDRESQSILFRLEQNGEWTSPANVASDKHIVARTEGERFRGLAVADMTAPPFIGTGTDPESGVPTIAVLSLPLMKEADWSTVQDLDPALETPAWEVKPDPAIRPAEPLQTTIGIPVREDHLKDLRFSGLQAASVALSYDVSPSGSRSRRDKSEARVELFSLTTGRRTSQMKLSDDAELLALSPSGKRVLMMAERGSERVDVWDLENKRHVAGWKPTSSSFSSNVTSMFVDDDHVLILESEKLVLWEVPTCRAIYQIEKANGPGVSPTGKYLAVRSGNVYMMLEALTGRIVGRLTTDDSITAASFHPNGELFAAVTQVGGYFDTKFADLIVWEMKTGQRIAHVPLQYAGTRMHWCGDSHVLIDNTILVDIVRQVPVWTYSIRGGLHCILSPDDRHWYLTRPDRDGRKELKLRCASLPEAEVATRTAGKIGSELIAVKPGMEVAYSFKANNGPVSSTTEKAILEQVKLEILRNGMVPVEKSPIRVVLSMEERETDQQVTFYETPQDRPFPHIGGFGFPRPRFGRQQPQDLGPGQTVQGIAVDCTVRVTVDGDTIWESSRVFERAYTLQMKPGQSISDALRQQLWESGIGFFSHLRLPKYVYRAGEGFGYGETALTYDGPLTLGGDPIRPNDQLGYDGIIDVDLWRSILGP